MYLACSKSSRFYGRTREEGEQADNGRGHLLSGGQESRKTGRHKLLGLWLQPILEGSALREEVPQDPHVEDQALSGII